MPPGVVAVVVACRHDIELAGSYLHGIGIQRVARSQYVRGAYADRVPVLSTIEHHPQVEIALGVDGKGHPVGRRVHEGACRLPALLLIYICWHHTLVACRRHNDVAGARKAVEHGIEQLVVAPEVLARALAEGNNAWHAQTVGSIEDILEAQGVGGIGVFVQILRGYEVYVLRRGVGHYADVALPGHAAVWRAIASTGRYAQRMGAVRLVEPVARVAVCQQGVTSVVACADIVLRAYGVDRQLVPQAAYAVGAGRGVIEVGMGKVEAYVHHPYHHPLARERAWKPRASVCRHGTKMHGRRVHAQAHALTRLYAPHRRMARQRRHVANRQCHHVQVTIPGKLTARADAEHRVHTAICPDKCRQHPAVDGRHAATRPHCCLLTAAYSLLHGHTAEPRRQLGVIGTLGRQSRHHQRQRHQADEP